MSLDLKSGLQPTLQDHLLGTQPLVVWLVDSPYNHSGQLFNQFLSLVRKENGKMVRYSSIFPSFED